MVSSSTGRRVLFGAFKHTVIIQDLIRMTPTARFETTFDYGGERLALSDELDGVLAAAYHVHGLALYSCSTGLEMWRRKDIKKIQNMTLSHDGITAYCGREAAALAVMNMRTGETIRTIRGARAMYDSRYDGVQFLDGARPQLLDNTGMRRFFVDRTTFAFLDVAFAPGFLGLTESGGPVRCIDIRTGKERWRYEPQAGWHVLSLGFHEAKSCLLGVEWSFMKGGAKRLIRWSLAHGTVTNMLDLGECNDCCFALAGDVIIAATGDIIDSVTGMNRSTLSL